MESRYTVHILPSEWRWVIVAATLLVFLAFAPFVWVALADTRDWQFMGALHNYLDGGSYFAKMIQGQQGHWLVRFLHTPESYPGALMQELYPVLGHLARLSGLPLIALFHVARVGASLFMYLALYALAATIWQRVRTRRLFFLVASVGSGVGWMAALLLPGRSALFGDVWPDLQIPEIYPLYSTYMNVHFPLAIACLGLLAGIVIHALRPGSRATLLAGLPAIVLLSLALALLYPQALVPLAAALAAYVVARAPRHRAEARRAAGWLLALALPAAPLAFYYAVVVSTQPVYRVWNAQNVTPAPAPLALVLGLGIPLVLALPALARAVHRFEQVDDRVMLLWLVAIVVLLYLPTTVQRRFAIGLMLPVAYFATRGLEEVWLERVSRRYRGYVLAVLLPVMAVSQVFSLFLPVLPVIAGHPERAVGIFLERDYTRVFGWLQPRTALDDIILAAPIVSAWVPGWVGTRVVYGHPFETVDALQRRAEVEDWYRREAGSACAELPTAYDVRYVLVGPEERALGAAGCTATLTHVQTIGQVEVYAP